MCLATASRATRLQWFARAVIDDFGKRLVNLIPSRSAIPPFRLALSFLSLSQRKTSKKYARRSI